MRIRHLANFWRSLRQVFLALVVLYSFAAHAGSGITYQGRILKPDGTPLAGATVQFKLQIRTPDSASCLMYEEVQSLDMRNSNGAFAVTMNDGTGSRTDSSGYGLDRIFGNQGTFNFVSSTCASGSSYAPNPDDGRVLAVLFKDETMGTWEPIPPQKINFVPFAFESKQIAGFKADSLLRVVNASGDPIGGLTPLSNAQYTALMALVNGTSTQYAAPNTLGGVSIPSVSGLTNGQVLTWNTTTSTWVASTPSGGTPSANSVDSSKIVDGSITGADLSTTIAITTSGNVVAGGLSANTLKVFSPDNSNNVQLSVPNGGTPYVMTLPPAQGTTGQVLALDASNKLQWQSPGAYSQWTTQAPGINYMGGSVGIGTTSPGYTLDVAGAVNASQYLISTKNAVSIPATGTVVVGDTGAAGSLATNNTVMGSQAFNAGTTGNQNVAIGTNAIQVGNVSYTTAVGYQALQNVTSSGNTAVGFGSMTGATTAQSNVAMGATSLNGALTGTKNVSLGANSMQAATSADSNVSIGYSSGASLSTGANNTIVGTSAGGGVNTGSKNIVIGPSLSIVTAGASNQMNIGNVIFGNNINGTVGAGTVGIGSTSPVTKLQVNGSILVGDGGETCGSTYYGAIRYNGGNLQFCGTSGWSTLGVAGAGITGLSGDVTASGTGTVAATVASVGGSTAALVHSAELAANAATNNNTPSTIVARDAAGKFSAATVSISQAAFRSGASQVNLTSPASGVTTYTIQLPPTVATATGQVLSSDTSGVTSWTSLPTALPPNGTAGGDLSGTYPNPTVATIGTSTAALVHSAELAANAATNLNTNSAIVKRDGTGNFAANVITGNGLTLNNAGSLLNITNPIGGAWNMTLPATAGSNGQVLTTNGSGLMSWSTPLTSSSGFINGGNSFGATADLGTNDANALNIRTSGSTRMTVLANGNVGIGTSSPFYLLTVTDATSAPTIAIGPSTAATAAATLVFNTKNAGAPIYSEIKSDYLGAFYFKSANNFYAFQNGAGTNLMTVSNTGTLSVSDATPTNQNVGGALLLNGQYNGSSSSTFASVKGAKENATSGDQSGSMILSTSTSGGTLTERVRVSSTGNVGIGTTSPGAMLDVNGALKISANTADPTLVTNNSQFYSHVAFGPMISGFNFAVRTGNDGAITEKLRVTSAGNVGIGTTSPSSLLTVNGVIESKTGGIKFPDGTTQTTAASGASNTFIQNGNAFGANANLGTNDSNDLNLRTNSTTRMTVSAAGSVGIGTTSPDYPLTVNGGIHAMGNSTFDGDIYFGATTYGRFLWAVGSDVTTYSPSSTSKAKPDGARVTVQQSTFSDENLAATAYVTRNGNVEQNAYVGTVATAGATNYTPTIVIGQQTGATAYSERMRIDTSGRVGIGTTAPGFALDVNGDINTTGAFRINGSAISASGSNAWTQSGSNVYPTTATNVGIGVTTPVTKLQVGTAPTATAAYPLVALGTAPFDGSSAGKYAGSANGSFIGVNAATGFTGDILNLQVNGVQKFKVDYFGDVYGGGFSGYAASLSNALNTTYLSTSPGGVFYAASNPTVGDGYSALNTTKVKNSSSLVQTGFVGSLSVAGASNYSPALVFGQSRGGATTYVESMRIDSAGNVGIGTTSPSSPLTVNGVIESKTGGIKFPDGTTQTTAASGGSSQWTTNGTAIYNANTGAVGIGTTSPVSTSALTVKALPSTTVTALFSGGTYDDSQVVVQSNDATGYAALTLKQPGSYEWDIASNPSNGNLIFNPGNSYTSPSANSVYMTQAGSVGVGTSSPQSKLDIKGGAAIGTYAGSAAAPSNGLIVSGNVGIGTTSPSAQLHVYGASTPALKIQDSSSVYPLILSNAGASGSRIYHSSGTSSNIYIDAMSGGGSLSEIAFERNVSTTGSRVVNFYRGDNTTTIDHELSMGATAASYFAANGGRVGFGTSTPNASYRVDISGALKTDSLALNNGGSLLTITNPIGGAWNMTLPATAGSSGQVLTTDGSGVTSWATPSGGSQWTTQAPGINYTGGNVGIGTTSPGSRLTVVGPSSAGYPMTIQAAPGTGSGAYMNLALNNTSSGAYKSSVEFQNNGTPKFSFGVDYLGAGSNNFSLFDNVAGATRLWIDPAGNVGIGTTSPTANLHVNSTSGTAFIVSNSGSPALLVDAAGNTYAGSDTMAYDSHVLNWAFTNASDTYITSGFGGSTAKNIILKPYNGNVGIGTTAPASTLAVNGAITSTATSNSSTTIDFASGNLQYTSSSCGAMILKNLKSGGTYQLAVQGAAGGACSFTAYSDSGTTTVTLKTGPINMTQTAGAHMLFSFSVMGSFAYVTSVDGY